MEQFVVSARKYRPQTFQDVVGQEAITNTLVNAIEHNHLAQALLFTGPRGVGKTTCARILARKINQEGYDDPTEDFAFNVFELDAASNNTVDDIRNLIDQVRIPPQTGKYKVYIIDEVHMLSTSAFNAFLKTLEEPPRHAIFILATTEKHKILPTILSRCQIFDFKRITIQDAANHLAMVAQSQGVSYEEDALRIIAQKADGAMRDALSIFDRVVSYCGKHLSRQAVAENLNVLDFEYYVKITDMILVSHIPALLSSFDEILAKGFDGHHFIGGLASHFRNLMVCQTPETVRLLEVGDHGRKLYLDQAQRTSFAFLMQALEIANACDLQYKASQNPRLLVELCLMQLASSALGDEKKNDSTVIITPAQLQSALDNLGPNAFQEPFFKDAPNVAKMPEVTLEQVKEVVPVLADQQAPNNRPTQDQKLTITPEEVPSKAHLAPSLLEVMSEGVEEEVVNDPDQVSMFDMPEEVSPVQTAAAPKSFEDVPAQEVSATVLQEGSEAIIPQITTTSEAPVSFGDVPAQEVSATVLQEGFEAITPQTAVAPESFEEVSPREVAPQLMVTEEVNTLQEHLGEEVAAKKELPSVPKRVNAMSLSSIRKRKELENSLQQHVVDPQDLPQEAFTFERLMEEWVSYSERLAKNGMMLMSSLMGMGKPVLNAEGMIHFELPNVGSKISFEENKYELVNHLRKRLNNYAIEVTIIVNEEVVLPKRFITNKDKYERFVELNPAVALLKETLKLEIK